MQLRSLLTRSGPLHNHPFSKRFTRPLKLTTQFSWLLLLALPHSNAIPAQQLSAAAYAAMAAAEAKVADAKAADAKDWANDALSDLTKDQNNGASQAQLDDDRNVLNAASTAAAAAATAAAAADRANSDAQDAASGQNATAAENAAVAGQKAANDATTQDTLAKQADVNDDDAYGNPNSDAGKAQQAADANALAVDKAANAVVDAQQAYNDNPSPANLQALNAAEAALKDAQNGEPDSNGNPPPDDKEC